MWTGTRTRLRAKPVARSFGAASGVGGPSTGPAWATTPAGRTCGRTTSASGRPVGSCPGRKAGIFSGSQVDVRDAGRLVQPLAEVGHELVDGLLRLGVRAELGEELGRHGDDVGPGLDGLVDVGDVADAADDDLRGRAPLAQGLADLADDRGGVVADVPDAAPEQ